MTTQNWVNIGSGNGLLPDDTMPLPVPMLTYHQWDSMAKISQQVTKLIFFKFGLKIILSTLHPHLPGANELIIM